MNYNCVLLDGGYITIGKNILIGPNCQLYTPSYPIDYVARREDKETAYPIIIGEDCWLGGGVIVCPGVTIGDRCIIAAEQNGSDRAKYGDLLLQNLANRLGNKYALSTLKLYRLFYLTYPQLGHVIGDYLIHLPIGQSEISQLVLSGKSQSVISQFEAKENHAVTIGQSQIAQFNGVDPELLFNRLSFTHLAAR